MDLELSGKVAIVTGGSRGIGLAVGRVLAAEGAKVALVARNKAALDGAAAEISRRGSGQAKGFVCDTTDDAATKRMAADVAAAFARIDILVNCAAKPSGQARPPTLSEITTEEFWDHMNTKVMGYLRTAREVAPYMIKQGSGRIINVSGLGAKHVGTTIGSIRNVGVAALTKNLADELAPHGIQAICVHPGLVRTEATPGVIAAQAKAQGVSEAEIEKRMSARNLAKKIITGRRSPRWWRFWPRPRPSPSTAMQSRPVAERRARSTTDTRSRLASGSRAPGSRPRPSQSAGWRKEGRSRGRQSRLPRTASRRPVPLCV